MPLGLVKIAEDYAEEFIQRILEHVAYCDICDFEMVTPKCDIAIALCEEYQDIE